MRQRGTERVERPLRLLALFEGGVTTQAHLGVELAGNVAGLGKLNCGHLPKNEAACSATDLVLKNPRLRSAGAYANTEAWNIVVEKDSISRAAVEL
jgi:hypothetical protein